MFHDNLKVEIALLVVIGVLLLLFIFRRKSDGHHENKLTKFKNTYHKMLSFLRDNLKKKYSQIPEDIKAENKLQYKNVADTNMMKIMSLYIVYGDTVVNSSISVDETDEKMKQIDVEIQGIDDDVEISDVLSEIRDITKKMDEKLQ